MKTISLYTLSTLFLVLGITSCAKTTKRKMAGDWKVTSTLEVEEHHYAGYYKLTTSMTENLVSITEVNAPVGITPYNNSYSGTVNKNEFTINKDGTWLWVKDITLTHGNVADNTITEQSGSWSFSGKTKGDDFKKNERVIFNVESSKSTSIHKEDNEVMDTNEQYITYSAGEYVQIYTVTNSTKDQLEMTMESNFLYTADGQVTNNVVKSRQITLQAK